MKKELWLNSVIIVLSLIVFLRCSSPPKSFKEKTLDNMYPFLTNDEYQSLESVETDENIIIWLDAYWDMIDTAKLGTENEFRKEYHKRLEYANDNFPDLYGWGRSDRKRVYLLFGPPSYIEKSEAESIHISDFSIIKSIEIWYYTSIGDNKSLPPFGDKLYAGEKKFVFADLTGSGVYRAIFSTEESEYLDSRWWYTKKYEESTN